MHQKLSSPHPYPQRLLDFLRFLGNILFPVRCLSCGREGQDICRSCFSKMKPAKETLPGIFSLFNYHDRIVRKAIKQLKYRGNKKIATLFAPALYDFLLEELADSVMFFGEKSVVLVPLPMSPQRKFARGGNHTETLAEALESYDKENIFTVAKNILYRTRYTSQQATQKTKEARVKNIHGSFAVKNVSSLRNKKIILLDDVATTGTTLDEAERVLREAGVTEILKVTLAH